MKTIFVAFFLFALAISSFGATVFLFDSISIYVFATNSFDQSIQDTQQALQDSINRQVQQSITDTISGIDNSTNTSSSGPEETLSQAVPINSSINNTIRGGIVSLQNDPTNNETLWILGGIYKIENLTAESPSFNASFYMVKTNGSSSHSHDVYDSKLRIVTNNTIGNNSTFLNGTSTVTMRDGPVMNVPTNITLFADNAISVWFDATKLNMHFGNSPIYGTQELKCVEIPTLCK